MKFSAKKVCLDESFDVPLDVCLVFVKYLLCKGLRLVENFL